MSTYKNTYTARAISRRYNLRKHKALNTLFFKSLDGGDQHRVIAPYGYTLESYHGANKIGELRV